MGKTYQEHCKEAYERDPKTYRALLNPDGTLKSLPKMTNMFKRVKTRPPEIKIETNKKIKEKSRPIIIPETQNIPKIKIGKTWIKVNKRKMSLKILKITNGLSRKEYNRRWMHNDRVRKRIKRLKDKYGVTT